MLSSVCSPDAFLSDTLPGVRPDSHVETIIPGHHSSSLFGIIHEKDSLIQRQQMGSRTGLVRKSKPAPSGNMALPPHRVALGQKREPKRRVIFRAKEENDVTPDDEAEAIC